MSIEILAKQGRDRVYGGLAAIDSSKSRQMRDNALRSCFTRLDEVSYRMEFVARIHGLEFINDAAARSVNATWYALERLEGGIVWIAFGGDEETIGEAVHVACYSGFENVKVLFSPATRRGLSDESAGRIFSHEVNEL